jgi:hypothetical protein
VRVTGGANRRAICYGTYHVIHHVSGFELQPYRGGGQHRRSYEHRRHAPFHGAFHPLGFGSWSLRVGHQLLISRRLIELAWVSKLSQRGR